MALNRTLIILDSGVHTSETEEEIAAATQKNWAKKHTIKAPAWAGSTMLTLRQFKENKRNLSKNTPICQI